MVYIPAAIDLKPENVGFTASMKLKLFDFGLMTCVKKLSTAFDMYELSGFTGSLRYMAPEVGSAIPLLNIRSISVLIVEVH